VVYPSATDETEVLHSEALDWTARKICLAFFISEPASCWLGDASVLARLRSHLKKLSSVK
jgi:hypothetical protein